MRYFQIIPDHHGNVTLTETRKDGTVTRPMFERSLYIQNDMEKASFATHMGFQPSDDEAEIDYTLADATDYLDRFERVVLTEAEYPVLAEYFS